jgi:hypothetical protein
LATPLCFECPQKHLFHTAVLRGRIVTGSAAMLKD